MSTYTCKPREMAYALGKKDVKKVSTGPSDQDTLFTGANRVIIVNKQLETENGIKYYETKLKPVSNKQADLYGIVEW